jgi:hypothetical protein
LIISENIIEELSALEIAENQMNGTQNIDINTDKN